MIRVNKNYPTFGWIEVFLTPNQLVQAQRVVAARHEVGSEEVDTLCASLSSNLCEFTGAAVYELAAHIHPALSVSAPRRLSTHHIVYDVLTGNLR